MIGRRWADAAARKSAPRVFEAAVDQKSPPWDSSTDAATKCRARRLAPARSRASARMSHHISRGWCAICCGSSVQTLPTAARASMVAVKASLAALFEVSITGPGAASIAGIGQPGGLAAARGHDRDEDVLPGGADGGSAGGEGAEEDAPVRGATALGSRWDRLGRRLLALAVISLSSSGARSDFRARPFRGPPRPSRRYEVRPVRMSPRVSRPGVIRAPISRAVGLRRGHSEPGRSSASVIANGARGPAPARAAVRVPVTQVTEPKAMATPRVHKER